MRKTKFTPGPWRANGCVIEGPKMGLQVAQIQYRAAGGNIGFASQTKVEAFANADLIAAATELYGALEKVLNHPLTHLSGDIELIVYAVLAKARGEAHPSGGDRHGE